ncbi:BAG molecular chaperone regulator 2 [Mactra antiquata]
MEASSNQNNAERLLKLLSDVENRIESLRDQAYSIKREKENILGLLQDMHEHSNQAEVGEVDREDIESTTARLIMRCLSVDVNVSIPRNEMQEEAYRSVSEIINAINFKLETTTEDQSNIIESYLNACLPEPFSANIDSRFQSKVLGCTVDDQKLFRKQLQTMYKVSLKDLMCNSTKNKHILNGVNVTSERMQSSDTTQSQMEDKKDDMDDEMKNQM